MGDLVRRSQTKRGLNAPEYILPLGTPWHAGCGGNELAEGVEDPRMAPNGVLDHELLLRGAGFGSRAAQPTAAVSAVAWPRSIA